MNNGWISVVGRLEDELPPPGTDIIYYDSVRKCVRFGVCGYGEWWAGITHWHPLPDPPDGFPSITQNK